MHPSVRHSFTNSDDASLLEAARDATLRFLARPFWAWLGVLHILLIIGDGAFFFFLLVNWQAMCVPDASGKCEPRNWWYNLSIQVLNALFTYGVALTMAWRLANAHHLCCSRRSCAPGRDLYGRPTDAIWFSVPVGHRARDRRAPPGQHVRPVCKPGDENRFLRLLRFVGRLPGQRVDQRFLRAEHALRLRRRRLPGGAGGAAAPRRPRAVPTRPDREARGPGTF